MNILIGSCSGIVVMRVKSARIDAASAPAFRESLGQLVERGLSRFVIDLSEVTFVDSTGLGALVSALKVTGRPGSVAVSGAKESVATLFKVTRMDKVFRLFPDEAQAAAAMATG
jgi:anti-sigma B factor antagonist